MSVTVCIAYATHRSSNKTENVSQIYNIMQITKLFSRFFLRAIVVCYLMFDVVVVVAVEKLKVNEKATKLKMRKKK